MFAKSTENLLMPSKMKIYLCSALALLAIVFLTYANSLHNGFMLDDHDSFDVTKKNIKFLPYHFIPDKNKLLGIEHGGQDFHYRPLASVIPMLYYLAFKDNTFGYHMMSLILFWAAGFLLYMFINTLFQNQSLAFLTSLFYLVHPINGVAVNFITGSVLPAQVILMLLSLMSYWRALEGKGSPYGFYILSFVFFLFSVMCHETAMGLPFYLLCLLLVKEEDKRKALMKSAPFFLFLLLYFLFRLKFASLNSSILGNYAQFHMNAFEYLASVTKLVVIYFSKFFYPHRIVLIWATSVVREDVFWWCAALAGLLSLFVFLITRYNKEPAVLLGLSWLFVGFLPFSLACLFQPTRGLTIEPHWFLFSSTGFFLLLASFIVRLSLKFRKIMRVFVSIVVLAWMFLSFSHNRIWGDEKRYCYEWLKESPEFDAVYFHLAEVYELEKQYDKARYCLKKGLTSHPKDQFRYVATLGLMDMMEKNWEEAKKHFQVALELNPHSSGELSNLGAIYYQEKNFKMAKEYFLKAVDEDRLAVLPRLNLATMLRKEGNKMGAIKAYQEILSVIPHHELSLISLIKVYMEDKDKDNILKTAKELYAFSNNPETLTNVGILFASYNFDKEAMDACAKSIKQVPSYREAYLVISRLYEKERKFDAALQYLQRGLQLDPQDRRFQENIHRLQAASNSR